MSLANATGRVVVYGGRGALGAACVSFFKTKNWWVGSIDLKASEEADANVLVSPDSSWADQQSAVVNDIGKLLDGSKLDAVICVAGGWAGGNADNKDFIKNTDLMIRQSVWSSTIAASVAAKYLKEGGLLTLTGAKPALGPTPGMIGYGMAKAAVHQLTKSLGQDGGGLPANSTTLAILPVTLDTPMNRQWMPAADTTTWTPLSFVADLLFTWTEGRNRPANGSLVSLVTTNNVTDLLLA